MSKTKNFQMDDFVELKNVLQNMIRKKRNQALLSGLEKGINAMQQLNQEELQVIWFDPKNRLSTDIECIEPEIEDLDELDRYEPPTHHFWVFVSSHIGAHSKETAEALQWLQKRNQKGVVIVIDPGDSEQQTKAEKAIRPHLKSEIAILFEEEGSIASEDILPPEMEREDIKNKIISKWMLSVVSEHSDAVENLLTELDKKFNSINSILSKIRSEISAIDELRSNIDLKINRKFNRLKDEIPNFEWLEAFMTMDLFDPDDFEQELEEEDVDDGEKKNVERELNQNKEKIIKVVKKELENKIKSHLHIAFKRQLGLQNRVEEITGLNQDRGTLSLLQNCHDYLRPNDQFKPYKFTDPPGWDLKDQKLEEIVKQTVKKSSIPDRLVIKIVSALVKLKIGNAAPFVIQELLDTWAKTVYQNALYACERELDDYSHKLEQWLGHCRETIKEMIEQCQDLREEINLRTDKVQKFRVSSLVT